MRRKWYTMAARHCREFPRVAEVRAYVKKTTGDQGADCHDVVDQHWINGYPTPIANPMSPYPRYHDYRKSWGINALGSVIVEVESEDGTVGVGKDRLPVYCTTARPDIAKSLGFVGAKIPCAYGPCDGGEGLQKNIQLFREARESVGNDFPLMLDCYMGLSLPYSIRLAKALQPYNLKWIEECLPPDDYTGYAELSKALRGVTMVTTGEHEYTRFGYRQLLESRCADILQPDVTWMGGLTEARRVVALASSYDIPVIPHGSSVYSYHLQYAFTSCPLAEYIILSPKADEIVPYFGGLFPDEPLPQDGFIDLPDRPGFGVSLDKTDLERPYPRSSDQVKMQCRANSQQTLAATSARMPF